MKHAISSIVEGFLWVIAAAAFGGCAGYLVWLYRSVTGWEAVSPWSSGDPASPWVPAAACAGVCSLCCFVIYCWHIGEQGKS